MVFGKNNYILLCTSIVVILIGFLLMSGGGSADSMTFESELFSMRRIIVAPLVTLFGFILAGCAIMIPPHGKKKS